MKENTKCARHREEKVEMLKTVRQKTFLMCCCLSCWEEKEYCEALNDYEKALQKFKSQSFFSRFLEQEPAKLSRYEIRKRVRDWAAGQKKWVKDFKEGLKKEYYRSAPPDFTIVQDLSGTEFENYMEALFKKKGYDVTTTPATGDGGVDLIISRKINGRNARTAVRCKRYKKSVGVSAIQEVFAGKHLYKCQKSMVITTSEFTKPAIKTANDLKVVLWDKYKLIEEINRTLQLKIGMTVSWEQFVSKHTLDDEFPM
ncbi:restriction endonuclease [Bacillus rhizoplanae]|uniref:restriction endonuclease n=1 Tax=Bacillus rhizoplanae TaxID=2880966 RepID=UPI003D1E45D7